MILAAVVAAAIAGAAPLPPELPWQDRSEQMVAKSGDPWITPSEAAGFVTTPNADETRAWLDRLAIDQLLLHGVMIETITAPREVEVEMARLVDPKLGEAVEGRTSLQARVTRSIRRETFPPGSIRVPSDQPLGALAAAWLEPESAEGALAWGFVPGILQRTEYIEGYAIAPLADTMLKDPVVKAAFDARLAADPAFAADGDARLAWYYARTPYYDDRYLLYPVGRELR